MSSEIILSPVRRSRPLGPDEKRRTAGEALALVAPLARAYDPEARLFHLVSGSDIGPDGRSSRWELLWDLPGRRAQAIFSLGLLDDAEHSGSEADAMLEIVRPSGPAGKPETERAWQLGLARRGSLPLTFRDSPEAVEELANQGADFISGDTSMVLASRRLPDGSFVWEAEAYDVSYRTPFAPGREQAESGAGR